MSLTKAQLTRLGVSLGRADRHISRLNSALQDGEINTPLRKAHFLAQVLHESDKLRIVREDLDYDAGDLRRIFSQHFQNRKSTNGYARKPQRIANRVYANKLDNGDEASGDGFRYRGRGFLQLRGKRYYRKFARWINDDDVVTNPESVADDYPVQSALFLWTINDINALADADDVRAVTRQVSGGHSGLDKRLELLEQARDLLRVDVEPIPLKVTHVVDAIEVGLFSRPRAWPSNLRATLSQGTEVQELEDGLPAGWSHIGVVLNDRPLKGFVESRFLRAVSAHTTDGREPRVQPLRGVHLTARRSGSITRKRDGGRAYELNEIEMPRRRGTRSETLRRAMMEIVAYLDSENPQHERYQRGSGKTYCNIYAYDLCYLAKAYLPRVWWKDRAIERLRNGESVDVLYDRTVRELSANSLYDWLEDHGQSFGWQRVFDLDELQSAANNGEVCVIVGQRYDRNRSGHISAVVPEHDFVRAERGSDGSVTKPLQSQAGRNNYRESSAPDTWWRGRQFRSFMFWRHP